MSASTDPYLIPDSKFVRSAQRYGLSHTHLTQIALGFNRGTKLQALAQQTGTSWALLRWLHRLPWQAALVIPFAHPSVSTKALGSPSLTTMDKSSIRALRSFKISASDIATYLDLPVALVTNALRPRYVPGLASDGQTDDNARRFDDEPKVDHERLGTNSSDAPIGRA